MGVSEDRNSDLYEVCHEAANFYQNRLLSGTEQSLSAHSYLEKRLSEESIQNWTLGYAPNLGWVLRDHLMSLGFDIKTIAAAGLIKKSDRRKIGDHRDYYDFFRDRVMFPIRTENGKIVGFGARRLDDTNKEIPKYINSPETPIYKKGNLIYGLFEGKQNIIESKEAIIEEGYVDVIKTHEYGIKNAVGPCGTAFTQSNIEKLAKLANRLVLCFDGDVQGANAALRVGINIVSYGTPLLVANLTTSGETKIDPDEFLIKYGADEFRKIISGAGSIADFALATYGINKETEKTENPDTTFTQLREVYKIMDASRNTAQKALWIKYIAEKIGLDERVLEKDYCKYLVEEQQKQRNIYGINYGRRQASDSNIEELVLGFLATNPVYRRSVKTKITEEYFSKEEYRAFFNFLCEHNGVDDAVLRPSVKLEMGTLFSEANNENLFYEFEKYCKEKEIRLNEIQISHLKGKMMRSINNNPSVITSLKKKGMIKKLRDMDYQIQYLQRQEISTANLNELDKLASRYKATFEDLKKLQGGEQNSHTQ